MGQRATTLLYDATSTAGGSLDSGVIVTQQYTALQIAVAGVGAAAPTFAAAFMSLDGGGLAAVAALTLPGANGASVSVVTSPPVPLALSGDGWRGLNGPTRCLRDSRMTELMKIEVAKAIALAFDNSGGVIRSDNLHALVDSYTEALSRLAAADPQAVEGVIRERDEAIRSAAEASKEIEALRARALAAETAANQRASEAEAAATERTETLRQLRDSAATSAALRAALHLKMSEYRPHDQGFCAACDAARAALKE